MRGLKRGVFATARSSFTSAPLRHARVSEISKVFSDGIIEGLIGAAILAVWFFFLDSLDGRPFYTPTALGTALLRSGVGLDSPESLRISFEIVLMYTWVHGLAFCAIGGLASLLLDLAERNLKSRF